MWWWVHKNAFDYNTVCSWQKVMCTMTKSQDFYTNKLRITIRLKTSGILIYSVLERHEDKCLHSVLYTYTHYMSISSHGIIRNFLSSQLIRNLIKHREYNNCYIWSYSTNRTVQCKVLCNWLIMLILYSLTYLKQYYIEA